MAKKEPMIEEKTIKSEKERKSRNRKIKAVFTSENIYSNSSDASALQSKSVFGERKEGKVIYSIFEALYLIERKKMNVYFKNKRIRFEDLISKARKKDKNVLTKYLVFKDMRTRGFVVKTALKFGAEFRVYDRGVKPGKKHARWILYPVSENSSLTWHDFSAKNRVAHSTKKNLLIGIVDEEEDVTYYEVAWKKP